MDGPVRFENPHCRYDAIFHCPKNVSELPVQFKYIDSDYKSFAKSDVNSVIKVEVGNLYRGITGSAVTLFFALINCLRSPFIGTDLFKLYIFATVRLLEGACSAIVNPFNSTLGSYLEEEAYHHLVLYDSILERLKDQDISFSSN